MSTPSTSAYHGAPPGWTVVPSPQPRSSTFNPGVIPSSLTSASPLSRMLSAIRVKSPFSHSALFEVHSAPAFSADLTSSQPSRGRGPASPSGVHPIFVASDTCGEQPLWIPTDEQPNWGEAVRAVGRPVIRRRSRNGSADGTCAPPMPDRPGPRRRRIELGEEAPRRGLLCLACRLGRVPRGRLLRAGEVVRRRDGAEGRLSQGGLRARHLRVRSSCCAIWEPDCRFVSAP